MGALILTVDYVFSGMPYALALHFELPCLLPYAAAAPQVSQIQLLPLESRILSGLLSLGSLKKTPKKGILSLDP